MNRRGFIRGAISVMAMAAILKGQKLEPEHRYVTYGTAELCFNSQPILQTTPTGLLVQPRHEAMARSILSTQNRLLRHSLEQT